MPFYEYQCQSCQHQIEVLQKISDPPLRKCPECGKQKLQRLISAPVFRLKGGGWYETDFKSDKEGKRNLAGGDDAPESKPDDAKPAASDKPDAKPVEAKPAEKKDSGGGSTTTRTAPRAKPPAKAKPKVKASKPAKKKSGRR
jgi:putative FmdB family regulatory protein